MSEIKYLSSFEDVAESGLRIPELGTITDIKQLPKELQIKDADINENSSFASFVCFCVHHSIPVEIISGRSGLSPKEITEVVAEARSIGIFMDLVDEFLKKE